MWLKRCPAIASCCHHLQSHHQNVAAMMVLAGFFIGYAQTGLCTGKASTKTELKQEQLAWHIDLLHQHVVSSSRLLGAGSCYQDRFQNFNFQVFFFVFYLFLGFYSFYKYARYITNFYMHKFTLHYSITQRKYHYTGLRE